MRRFVLGCLMLLFGIVGVFVYDGVAREREFRRLIAEGDEAVLAYETILAIDAYSAALALYPDSMLVHLKRGETYQQQGNLRNAVQDLSQAARLDPNATRPHERLGDLSIALEDYAGAIKHYARYVGLDDQNPRILYKLALANERAGRVNSAIPLLRQAIALDPKFAEAHYVLGLCLREEDRLDESRDVLTRAVKLLPGLLQAREVLAAIHGALGERSDELRQLDALAALDPEHPERRVERGLAYARAGQTEMAILALERTAEDHPDQPEVDAALGRVWMEIAETQGDRVALGKAHEALLSVPMTAAISETLALLGQARLLNNDTEGARRTFQQAIERFPVDPTAFLRLASLEELNHNWSEARRLRQNYRLLTEPSSSTLRVGLTNSTD